MNYSACHELGTNKKSESPTGFEPMIWDTNMAAVSLFWDTNMDAVASCENTLCT